jgi:hypothetical protein
MAEPSRSLTAPARGKADQRVRNRQPGRMRSGQPDPLAARAAVRAARLKLDRLESATALRDLAALPGNRCGGHGVRHGVSPCRHAIGASDP